MPLRMIASFRKPRGFGRVKENLTVKYCKSGFRKRRGGAGLGGFPADLVQELFRKQAPRSSEVSG